MFSFWISRLGLLFVCFVYRSRNLHWCRKYFSVEIRFLLKPMLRMKSTSLVLSLTLADMPTSAKKSRSGAVVVLMTIQQWPLCVSFDTFGWPELCGTISRPWLGCSNDSRQQIMRGDLKTHHYLYCSAAFVKSLLFMYFNKNRLEEKRAKRKK